MRQAVIRLRKKGLGIKQIKNNFGLDWEQCIQ